MTKPKHISFAEIVQGRHSSVKVTDDGLLHASELAMVVHGGSRNYVNQVIMHTIIHFLMHFWQIPKMHDAFLAKSQKCMMHSWQNPKNA
jgi:hypothetical protein